MKVAVMHVGRDALTALTVVEIRPELLARLRSGDQYFEVPPRMWLDDLRRDDQPTLDLCRYRMWAETIQMGGARADLVLIDGPVGTLDVAQVERLLGRMRPTRH